MHFKKFLENFFEIQNLLHTLHRSDLGAGRDRGDASETEKLL